MGQEKRGRMIVFLPMNTHHAEVSAKKRRDYMGNGEIKGILKRLRRAGIPIAVSMHPMHMEEVGIDPTDFDGLELADTTFSHFLPPIWDRTEHGEWQYKNGLVRKSPFWFSPEYMPSNIPFRIPPAGYVIPVVGPNSYLYSALQTDERELEGCEAIAGYEAISFNGNVLVPMIDTVGLRKTFHEFASTPTDENCRAVVEEMRRLVLDGTGKTRVWGMDLEAPIVGGFHGFELWDKLFHEIAASDIADCFVSFAEAAPALKAAAVKVPYSHFARNIGLKWTKWPVQLQYMIAAAQVPDPRNELEQRAFCLVSSSDVLAVMNRDLGEPFERDAMLRDGSTGRIRITCDATVKLIGRAALKAFSGDHFSVDHVIGALRHLRVSGDDNRVITDDGQEFANRLADVLQQHI